MTLSPAKLPAIANPVSGLREKATLAGVVVGAGVGRKKKKEMASSRDSRHLEA
jgi:hypothetical protein